MGRNTAVEPTKKDKKDKTMGKPRARSPSVDSSRSQDAERGSPARPGTSGTENLLMMTRREAATQLKRAARAETEYVTRKRADRGRVSLSEAKSHYGQAFHHLGQGIKKTFIGIKSVRYIFGEKKSTIQQKRSKKQAKKAARQRKKLEEKLARQENLAADHEENDDENEEEEH
ncbi:hypothetical protein TD95_003738 [Thielaviopsis punctulata]|uniref:Uncharacterized protein n=1 Tax=Thielaviopsis punctulata TaxID=72032 RepID=A0A0F4Z7J9_9PEZI|nr:hypothetical protein TD95_003738 [Thielaviopsis punctulata]